MILKRIFLSALEKVMSSKSDNLLDLSSSDSIFTFFVPTDQAFQSLSNETIAKFSYDSAFLKTVRTSTIAVII